MNSAAEINHIGIATSMKRMVKVATKRKTADFYGSCKVTRRTTNSYTSTRGSSTSNNFIVDYISSLVSISELYPRCLSGI